MQGCCSPEDVQENVAATGAQQPSTLHLIGVDGVLAASSNRLLDAVTETATHCADVDDLKATASGLEVAKVSRMKSYLLLTVAALSVPTSAFAEEPAGIAPGALAPTAEQCAACEKQKPAAPEVDSERRGGGIALTVLGSAGIVAGISLGVWGEVNTFNRCDPGCEVSDARGIWTIAGPTIGFGVSLVSFGVVLLATDAWKYEERKAAAGEPFAIDERPRAVAPRYWLGEL